MRLEIILLHPPRWLTCHYKHLLNPQLGYKVLRRHKNANNKRTHKIEKAVKEAENAKEKPREKPREL